MLVFFKLLLSSFVLGFCGFILYTLIRVYEAFWDKDEPLECALCVFVTFILISSIMVSLILGFGLIFL